MSSKAQPKPLTLHRPQQASESFAEFSARERERRQDSGEGFDPALFAEATDLILRKLRKLEEEGLA